MEEWILIKFEKSLMCYINNTHKFWQAQIWIFDPLYGKIWIWLKVASSKMSGEIFRSLWDPTQYPLIKYCIWLFMWSCPTSFATIKSCNWKLLTCQSCRKPHFTLKLNKFGKSAKVGLDLKWEIILNSQGKWRILIFIMWSISWKKYHVDGILCQEVIHLQIVPLG